MFESQDSRCQSNGGAALDAMASPPSVPEPSGAVRGVTSDVEWVRSQFPAFADPRLARWSYGKTREAVTPFAMFATR